VSLVPKVVRRMAVGDARGVDGEIARALRELE
jgi:hypothetical protein